MVADPLLVVNEQDVDPFRVAREGSGGYLLIRRLIDPETSNSVNALVLTAEVPPHQTETVPLHYHREYEETMYVVSGRGRFLVGPSPDAIQTRTIGPRDCLYIPTDHYHGVIVDGDEPIHFVISYFCTSGAGGKSHRQIALELTSLPFQGEYGQPAGSPAHDE